MRCTVPAPGQETARRILGVDAALERVTALRRRERFGRQRHAGSDFQLQAHQVESGHHLGDRVLDLQARIHFQEVEVAVRVEKELDRAGATIVHGARGGDRGFAHARAQFGRP